MTWSWKEIFSLFVSGALFFLSRSRFTHASPPHIWRGDSIYLVFQENFPRPRFNHGISMSRFDVRIRIIIKRLFVCLLFDIKTTIYFKHHKKYLFTDVFLTLPLQTPFHNFWTCAFHQSKLDLSSWQANLPGWIMKLVLHRASRQPNLSPFYHNETRAHFETQ